MRRPQFVIGALAALALVILAMAAIRWQVAQQCPALAVEIGHILMAGCR